jgi:hypothetical protein
MDYESQQAPPSPGFFSQLGSMVSGAALRVGEIAKNAGNVAYNFVGSTVKGAQSMAGSTPATPVAAATQPTPVVGVGQAGGRRRTKKGGKRRTHPRRRRRV